MSCVPSGNSFSFSGRESFSGYGGSWPLPLSVGGMVVRGLEFVSAKTRALATLSAYVLNSAPGVICFRSFSSLRSGISGFLTSPKLGTGMFLVSDEFKRATGGADLRTAL